MKTATILEKIRELVEALPANARGDLAKVGLAIELIEDVDGAEAPIEALQAQRDAIEARLTATAEHCRKMRQVRWEKANTLEGRMTQPTWQPKPRPANAPAPIHHSVNETKPYWVKPDGTITFDPPERD